MTASWPLVAGCLGLAAWSAIQAMAARPAQRLRTATPAPSPTRAPAAVVRQLRGRLWSSSAAAAAALPDVVDTVAAGLRAGRSMADSLRTAADAAPPGLAGELRSTVAAVERGLALSLALDRWAATSPVPGASLVAAAAGLAGAAGGDPDAALAGVAATLRERRALAREIRALSSQARLSAVVIAAAPLGFATVAVAADGDIAAFLLGSTGGVGCLVAGTTLDLAGWRWMRRITASVR